MESPVPGCKVSSVAVCSWRHVCPHPVCRLLRGSAGAGKGRSACKESRIYELVRETRSLLSLWASSMLPLPVLPLRALEGLDDHHCPPDSGTLRSPPGAGRSCREAQLAGPLEARGKPRAPILSSPGFPATPASREVPRNPV